MKRGLFAPLALALVCCLAFGALAEAPAADSLNLTHVRKYRLDAWAEEGFSQIWLTTSYPSYLLEGDEDEPPVFLHVAGPAGYAPLMFDHEEAVFLNLELYTLLQYYLYDSYSFEQFMEDSAPEDIVLDGSDGMLAVIRQTDTRAAEALINVREFFGRSAKLRIRLTDYAEDQSMTALVAAVTAEAERVMADMTLVTLEGYWSTGAFGEVELYDPYDRVTVRLPVGDMTLTAAWDSSITLFYAREGEPVELGLSLTSYCRDEAQERALADGTPFLLYMNNEYDYGYASFPLKESRYGGTLYLEVEGDEPEAAFLELLEALWPQVGIDLGELD